MEPLFHVSHEGSIARFEPRPPPSHAVGITHDVVWALDGAHLAPYLLPRDCPRVTFAPSPASTAADIQCFMGPGSSQRVVAIEHAWFVRAQQESIWIYELPTGSFVLVDHTAGYYVSRETIRPQAQRKVENPLAELLSYGAELRVLDSLWPLRDRVIQSTLAFSCIRMRNAQPRNPHSQP